MSGQPCWVVFYHYVRPGAAGAGIRGLTPERFRVQLDAIQDAADIITYEELSAALDAGRDFGRPVALLTFDDGVTDHRDVVWPELRARGLSGVFFVNGGALDDPPALMNVHRTHLLLDTLGAAGVQRELGAWMQKHDTREVSSPDLYRYDADAEQVVKRLLNYELPYDVLDEALEALVATHLGDAVSTARAFYLTAADVRRMAEEGATFGWHTARHRVLSRLDEAGQRAELAGGVEQIRDLTGQRAVPFCYPYGHRLTYDRVTLGLLAELGYDAAFNTVRAPLRPSTAARFELPRYDTRDLTPEGAVAIAPVESSVS